MVLGHRYASDVPNDVGLGLSAVFRASRRGLPDLFDHASGLMARRAVGTPTGWRLESPSSRNTAIVLQALHRMHDHDLETGLDAEALSTRLYELRHELTGADLGLCLWAEAVGPGGYADMYFDLVDRCVDDMTEVLELSWVLAATAIYAARVGKAERVARRLRKLAARIQAHQHASTGLFRSSRRRRGLWRRLSADASLPSQFYPVFALVKYAEASGDDSALTAARRCAERLVGLQGASGQWWWRYDVEKGTVKTPYPIYSVSQDGAAVLALGALSRHVGADRFRTAAVRGLRWEWGANEVGYTLVNERTGRIARSIDREGEHWHVSWDWYSYHPGRAMGALLDEGQAFGWNPGES